MKQKEKVSPLVIAAVAVSVILVIVTGVLVTMNQLATRHTGESVAVEIEKLEREWRTNPVAESQRYQRVYVVVSGVITDIDAGLGASITISQPSTSLIDPSIRIRVPQSLVPSLANFPRGSTVTAYLQMGEPVNPPRPVLVSIEAAKPKS